MEGKTENMVRRLDYSPSLLGKHKRMSLFVELFGKNIKWIFIINTTIFLLQCITKTRITTCILQLSFHRNDNYCLLKIETSCFAGVWVSFQERCVLWKQVFYKITFRIEFLLILVTSKLTAQYRSGKQLF